MSEDSLFNVAIATIFAREFLEGAIIIGNYRTVIIKNENLEEEKKKQMLKNVTYAALFATFIAILVVLAVAIPLGILSNELDEKTADIIEGVSKVVAAICILQLSLKIPKWLGIYRKVSILPWKRNVPKWANHSMDSTRHFEANVGTAKDTKEEGTDADISLREIRFNVSWNIWREVAECGVFLIPFFLGTGAKAIPVSALVGIAISLVIGLGLYWANQKMKNKKWLAIFMAGLTMFLAVGLFVGGCHEFEEVWGETKKVYVIEGAFWSHKKFPMVLLKPFGYSSSRTVLQICCFWIFLAFSLFLHYLKWRGTKQVIAYEAAKAEYEAGQKLEGSQDEQEDVEAQPAEQPAETSSEEDADNTVGRVASEDGADKVFSATADYHT